jgi:hypothetical protein
MMVQRIGTWVLTFAASMLLSARASLAETRRFALVVGSNDPGDSGMQALQFADDDAFRNHEVLTLLGVQAMLLVAPDLRTRQRYLPAGTAPEAPTKANLTRALEQIFGQARAARESGQQVEFYFWYSGHGARKGTAGELYLEGGDRFTRSDLYRLVVRASPAHFNHIFVDACGAAAFVSARGPDQDPATQRARQKELLESYVAAQALASARNVGVLFAGTRDDRVHEWSQYEGGVFSFQLRSAMLAAADAEADRRITYLEAYAFMTAANQRVQGHEAHMDVALRVHRDDQARVLADWSAGARGGALVRVRGGKARHVRISDDRDVALLETNKDVPDEVTLVLPPRAGYSVTQVQDPAGGRVQVAELRPGVEPIDLDQLLDGSGSDTIAARGDVLPQLRRGLFREPFGLSYYRGIAAGMQSALGLVSSRGGEGASGDPASRSGLRPWAYGLLAGAGGSLAAAGIFYGLADSSFSQWQRAAEMDKPGLRQRTERFDRATNIALIGAGLAAVAGGALLVRGWNEPQLATVLVAPTGIQVFTTF